MVWALESTGAFPAPAFSPKRSPVYLSRTIRAMFWTEGKYIFQLVVRRKTFDRGATVEIIVKLLDSFAELERCIDTTRSVLREREDVSDDVISRVNQYSEMVEKQRSLALELEPLIVSQDWPNVTRNVKLINAYSNFIREDARSILAQATGMLPELDREAREKVLA